MTRHARPMVIDLDEVSFAPETSARRPWNSYLAAARPVALVAVMLIALALAGSARPLPALRQVMAVEDTPGTFVLASSALFTSGFGGAPGSPALLRRFSLASLSTQWSTELPVTVGNLDLAEPAHVLVAISADGAQTTFLDSDTGTVLWRSGWGESNVLRLSGTSALMSSTAGAPVLRRVDLRTGATLWSRDIDPDGYLDAGDRIVTVDTRGRATVIDFADGAVLASADLGVAPSVTNDDGLSDTALFTVVGDRLYLTRRNDGAVSLTAYRLADFRQVWRNTSTPLGWPTGCGPYVCVTTSFGMSVLDGDSGAVRWSDARWRVGYDTREVGMPGPRRLAVIDDQASPERALLDPATGRVLSLLGHSVYVGTILLRSDTEHHGRTWVQVADRRNDFHTVGSVDNVAPDSCAAVPDYLACPTTGGRTTVWRVAN